MKKIHFILLYVLGLHTSLCAQWLQLNYTPPQSLNAICTINMDTVVAVGDSGSIVRTTDAGLHWTVITSNTKNHLYRIKFPTKNVGYISGANGTILKTTDAGVNWTNLSVSTNMSLISISFINKDTGWVVGGDISDIYYDQSGAFPNAPGVIIKTRNGGLNWNIDSSYNTISSVCLIDKDTGYITTNYSNEQGGATYNTIQKTIDGGNTFTAIILDSSFRYFTDVSFINPTNGFVVKATGGFGKIDKTLDCGLTWIDALHVPTPQDVFPIDSCNFYVSYFNGVSSGFEGYDYCQQNYYNSMNDIIRGACFLNKDYGFAASDYIYKLDTSYHANSQDRYENNLVIKPYPNPFASKVSIYSTSFITSKKSDIIIYNSFGSPITVPFTLKNDEIIFDFESYPLGLYYMFLKGNENTLKPIKLLKE